MTTSGNNRAKKPKAADEAADRVRQAILTGELPAGRDLPAERELSEKLGVSRLTLRAAIARLEAEGLVRPVHGSGTRVLDFRESGGVDLVGYLARLAVEGGTVPVQLLADLLELRRAIAVEALGLACERGSPGEIEAMRAHVQMQGELIDDPARFVAADLQMARLLLRATHNLAVELMFNTIVRVIEKNPALEAAFLVNPRQTLVVYGKLLDLVEARDADRVRRVSKRLFERLDRVTLDRVRALVAMLPEAPVRPPTLFPPPQEQ
jgi:GntR family transcriptional regulator, transcriptional repressor for pyruvate dehydrogenase complex